MKVPSSAGTGLLMAVAWVAVAEVPPVIRLNTLGYLPDATKRATVAAPCTHFEVVRVSTGVRAFEGRISGPATNVDTRELLYAADFSSLNEEGVYRVQVPGVGASAPFRIATDVYRGAFGTVSRGMYLWRCGCRVSGALGENRFTHEACHTNDASLRFVGEGDGRKNGVGGWHDAGDYNKYVVNAGVTVGCLFRAWEDFGPAIRRVALDLPEQGGPLPEFLEELRWELDWLLTMQAPDGSVYHKLSTPDFGGFQLPEDERQTRYFAPWSSAATADFVAMTALASRQFRPYDPDYAERCLAAAQKSHAFLQSHPDNHPADLSGFTTGGYQTRDADDRLWAAAELWETSGDPKVLAELEGRIRLLRELVDTDFDWGNVANLGLITYVFSARLGRDVALIAEIRSNLVTVADGIVETRSQHGYERPLGTRYYWGCNGSVARQVIVLRAAWRVEPNRRSGADDVLDPWPGYLVGGPNRGALSWEDVQANYRVNEIAINWNAALIYALAGFLDESAWDQSVVSGLNREPGAPSQR